jgi:hypothetical protein
MQKNFQKWLLSLKEEWPENDLRIGISFQQALLMMQMIVLKKLQPGKPHKMLLPH